MKVTSLITLACAAVAVTLSSCTNFGGSADEYTLNEIGSAATTLEGTVSYVRYVKIKSNSATTGTAIGAVAGGLAGAMLGGGSARLATSAGGVILGGIAGNQIDQAVNTKTGEQITVRLDSRYNGSRDITITQVASKKNPIQEGQRVRVLIGSRGSRVLAY